MSGDEVAVAEHDEGAQRRNLRPAIIVVVAVVAIFVLLFLWRAWRTAPPPQSAPPPTSVVATVVGPTRVPSALEAVGSLRAVREVMLAPEVAGRVSSLGFTGGQYVGAGATLVQLYDGPERADRQAAAAKAEFARLQLARSRQLAPSGAESRETLQQRQAEYDQAIAAVRQLDARLVQKRVAAPFAGQIGVRQVNLGQYLNPGDQIASLTALDQLFVDFTVPQQELSKLQPGSEVRVTSDAWPGRTFTARVTTVEPRVDDKSRNIWVQATLANPDKALRPGMYITAALTLAPIEGTLVVPVTAIMTSAQGESIMAIRGTKARSEGKAEPVAVKTGRRFGDSVVVTSGIKAGDVVVTEGQLRVQPGANLRVSRLIPASGG
ncbi:efflux RND transporter periplasmic adaptor subunit [Novosphingobium sp. G106]|uniref:efflux RND transporter periplasmic adaptor subunit n=1 Tax=Novosphingobium sp. G106 TaxID=2849500 RepID=UPI001C2D3997|nr:efflux RND transporter periplasmic adaptor subunit [Novosphingobium sp. G106]MBV1689415.1 efflux RND transporter periplasmic adaptor subunit [Novosphingobium sp. G106]